MEEDVEEKPSDWRRVKAVKGDRLVRQLREDWGSVGSYEPS